MKISVNRAKTANYENLKHSVAFLTLLLLFSNAVFAQSGPKNSPNESISNDTSEASVEWLTFSDSHVHEFSIWGGYAFDSFKLWGKTPDATLGQLGLGYNRRFLRIGNQVFRYRFSVNLFSKITYPEFEESRNRASLSGFGLSPLGLRINFLQNRDLQPFLDAAGGIIVFNDPFPDVRGKKFNYTLGIGGGMEILLNSQSSLSLGYKYLHLSNGESGQVNPGVDSGFFFLALTLF